MKKNLLTSVIFFPMVIGISSFTLHAQSYCGSSRYDTEAMFPNVTVTSNVVYGWNTNLNNGTDTLKMDIYQPTGDVAAKRPLIVFAHGGSFIGGTKTDADEVTLATRFAKRGYITCSISYRLGMGFPINQTNAQKAVWRATQDMKAAVRFFRKDAATTNTYKVDPNYVFVGGYSAGAFMAVQYAYLDQSSEVPAGIDTTTTTGIGGIEGNSGNPGYSSAINAVLNFAGAVGDTSWMHYGDEPMVTVQGNADATVPYCTATIYVSGFPIMVVSGGGTMHIRCFHEGIENPIHTFYGQDHCAPVGASGCPAANMDTTVAIASDFLYKYLGCTPSGNPAVNINNQTCVPLATGISQQPEASSQFFVYPNPTTGKFQLSVSGNQSSVKNITVCNIFGEVIYQTPIINYLSPITIDLSFLPAGIYSLKITSESNEVHAVKLVLTEK